MQPNRLVADFITFLSFWVYYMSAKHLGRMFTLELPELEMMNTSCFFCPLFLSYWSGPQQHFYLRF